MDLALISSRLRKLVWWRIMLPVALAIATWIWLWWAPAISVLWLSLWVLNPELMLINERYRPRHIDDMPAVLRIEHGHLYLNGQRAPLEKVRQVAIEEYYDPAQAFLDLPLTKDIKGQFTFPREQTRQVYEWFAKHIPDARITR